MLVWYISANAVVIINGKLSDQITRQFINSIWNRNRIWGTLEFSNIPGLSKEEELHIKDYRDTNLEFNQKKVRFLGGKKNLHIFQAKFIIPILEASIYN